MTLRHRLQPFPRQFWPTLAMFVLLAAVFGVYVYSEKRIDRANDQRHVSVLLANQLRQSSDELTRMARTYVVTGDPRYKKYYHDILDIREGRKPRPPGYLHAYWDMVLADASSPQAGEGKAIALLELMREAEFAEDEFRKLAEAKAKSDALTAIEFEAMKLVETAGPDAPANRARAQLMMHDPGYHLAKAAIMRPINESYELMDKRTADRVSAAERNAMVFRMVFILCVFGAVLMLWRAYAALHMTLGGSAREVLAHILRIGRGDFSLTIAVPSGMENSVLAGLAAMQIKLQSSEIERRQAEQELAESALQLRTIIDTEPECVKMLAADGALLQMNRAGLAMIEADSFDQVEGRTIFGLISESHRKEFSALTKRVFKGESGSIEFEIRGLKGTTRWLDSHTVPMRNAQGVITAALSVTRDITERKRAEQSLAASETRLRAVLDGIQSGVITITERGMVESLNESAERMFGYSAAEVIGKNVNMLMPEPHKSRHDSYLDNYRATGIRKVICRRVDVVARRKDGSIFPIELGVTETFLNDRRLFIGSVSDISFRKEAEAELRIAATAFESQEGMVVTDPDGVILRVNKAFTEISGYTAEEAVGQKPRLLQSGRHDAAFYVAMWASVASTGAWQGEVWDRRKNGEIYPKWLTISAVKGDDGAVTHYVGTHQDITERKKAEERIQELAFFDSLTRLPNRTLLLDRLKQAMTAGNRNGTFGAVLFIDLDHFKTLNDTLGHDKGDLLLQQVAQRLAASVREGDTVARLGGDEFVMVLGSLNKTAEEAANETEAVGEKVLAVLSQTYPLGDIEYRSTASIGATLFRGHETSIEDLLKQADLAMYRSKETGRNGLHFFDPAMQTVVVERVALETGLRKAIECNQLLLHFQAQVDGAGRVTGAEALVRWPHPERGMVPPADFIPLAEETGLILPLGQWVLETACAQLAQWAICPDMAHLTVAVNVSAQEFRDPDFVLKVVAILNQTGANPNRLKLELTESLLVDNVEDVIETMFALKARGVGFSLDDFGTGYSSLSYLKRMPLDQLKIDQSFVRDILIDPNDAAIARTIVALAQSLGLGVIAEGVETETQRAFLASSGCHAYQGYFFSRPLPVKGFEEFVRRV